MHRNRLWKTGKGLLIVEKKVTLYIDTSELVFHFPKTEETLEETSRPSLSLEECYVI